jgi:hypothetical protein
MSATSNQSIRTQVRGAPHVLLRQRIIAVCRLKLRSWFSIYRCRCPANRGAMANPCADVPWHQVQLRTGTESAAASVAPVDITISRNTIFNGLIMIRVLHHENSRHST